jgi:hypothetical protein
MATAGVSNSGQIPTASPGKTLIRDYAFVANVTQHF